MPRPTHQRAREEGGRGKRQEGGVCRKWLAVMSELAAALLNRSASSPAQAAHFTQKRKKIDPGRETVLKLTLMNVFCVTEWQNGPV